MKIKNLIDSSIEYIRNNTVTTSLKRYSMFYSTLVLILISLKQVFSLIFYSSNEITNKSLYIAIYIIILVLIAVFLIIYIMKLKETNKIYKIFLSLYPFIFIVLGVLISNLYSDSNNIIISMTVIGFMISWIQIYPLFRRVLVYSSYIGFYYLFQIIIYGNDAFTNLNSSIFMISFSAFITSSIFYQVYLHNKKIIDDLSLKNKNINDVIKDLEYTHKDLIESKKMTFALFQMTQEVLRNENIEKVMQLILEKAISFIPSGQAGSILIKKNDMMQYVAAVGYNLENLKKIELREEELFQSKFEDKYKPEIIKNLETFDEVHIGKEKTILLKKEAANIAKSCLTCSFKYNGEFFGSINVDNFDSEDIFSQRDKYLMKQFSNEIEIIVSIHKLYEQAIRPAKYDDLTNALTRKYSIELIKKIIEKDVKNVISICMIDINDLKSVNDKYGHDIGDRFLAYYSESINNLDIKENIFGRIGGDEFVLAFNNTNKNDSLIEIEKIRSFFERYPFKFNETKIVISFSVGVSEFPFDSENINELIKLADRRMYNDKNKQKHLN